VVSRPHSLLSVRLAVMMLLLLLLGCESSVLPLTHGNPVPGFTLKRLDKESVSYPSTSFEGRVALIEFWADWCAQCRRALIDHEQVYREYKDRGLVVFAINIEQSQQTANAFIEGMNLTYDVLLDSQGDVARRYGVLGLPVTYVVDRKGNLSAKLIGGSAPDQLREVVTGLL
jgi:cytochrome c biogenesis protein CcmG/thiol:disulfide interchange protein DsbE